MSEADAAGDAELERLDEAIRVSDSDVSLRVRRGALLLAAGRPSEALADLDSAIESAGRDAAAYALRAQVRLALAESDADDAEEHREEALADLDSAAALAPADWAAPFLRGTLLRHLGCAGEAVEDLRRALALGADAASAGVWLAATALDADDADAAVAAADAAIAAGADSHAAHHWRAAALRAAENLPGALAACWQALRRDPDSASSLAVRAGVWSDLGEPERAERDLARAVGLDPEVPAYRFEHADVLEELGDARAADEEHARGVLLQAGERGEDGTMARRKLVYLLLRDHFGAVELDELTVHERLFPRRVRADVQRALDALHSTRFRVVEFTGLSSEYEHMPVTFGRVSKRSRHDPVMVSAPQWEDVDIGADAPVRCVVAGLWLLEADGVRAAMLVVAPGERGESGHRVQVAVPPGATALADEIFRLLEESVAAARCYRGKVLSLEACRSDYSGRATGIAVHRLPPVARDDVVLPEATLRLLERNVFDFIERRSRLRELRLSTKKGLLFYGPPGTGKTHTIRYLASTLVGQTTLLITADEIAMLVEDAIREMVEDGGSLNRALLGG